MRLPPLAAPAGAALGCATPRVLEHRTTAESTSRMHVDMWNASPR